MLDGIELNCPEPIGSQEKPSAPFSAVYFWSNCFINIVHATKQQRLAQLNPAVGCSSLVHFILCVVGNKSHWCFCRTPGSALQIYSSIVLVSWFNPKVERQIRRLPSSPRHWLFCPRLHEEISERVAEHPPACSDEILSLFPSWHKVRKKKPWVCIQGFTYTAVCEETWPGRQLLGGEVRNQHWT